MEQHNHTHQHVNIDPDSLEYGTPSKGGAIKIYFDVSNVDAAKKKIDKAKEIREYAQSQLSMEGIK